MWIPDGAPGSNFSPGRPRAEQTAFRPVPGRPPPQARMMIVGVDPRFGTQSVGQPAPAMAGKPVPYVGFNAGPRASTTNSDVTPARQAEARSRVAQWSPAVEESRTKSGTSWMDVVGAIFSGIGTLLGAVATLIYNLLWIGIGVGAAYLAVSLSVPGLWLVTAVAVGALIAYWTTGWMFFIG